MAKRKAIWRSITDLPSDWKSLASQDLAALGPIWNEQSDRLRETEALKNFNERLCREWAIETGIIEDLYTIDRGITQVLIEQGIAENLITHGSTDRPAEQIVPILKDQEDVVEGLFAFVKSDRQLSISYIKELHQAFTRHQDTAEAKNGFGRTIEMPLEKGIWKSQPNNPTRADGTTFLYCPPEHVQTEMERLITLHLEHDKQSVPTEIKAAWLHHRFTQIHPFQDGNGRVARALASLVFLKVGWFPLVVHRDHLSEYIATLEKADEDDLLSLITLFSEIQKQAFLRALSISEDLLTSQSPIHEIIQAAADRLVAREHQQHLEHQKVFDLAAMLADIALDELQKVSVDVGRTLNKIDSKFSADAEKSFNDNDFWFHRDIVTIAKSIGYFANTTTFRQWVRLRIREHRQAELVISFHSIGVDFVGLVGCTAFLNFRDRSENGEVSVDGPYPLMKSIFQISYNEDPDVGAVRFQKWLNEVIVNGLDHWRRQI